MEEFHGFLLSYVKYGDQDAVLHFFTRESGSRSFFVKNIYSPKSKKKPYLAPLNQLSFSTGRTRNSGNMALVSNLELLEKNADYPDVREYSVLFFLSEVLNTVLKNNSDPAAIYDEIIVLKDEISKRNFSCHALFLVKILKILGFAPLLSEGGFLDPESGTFVEMRSHAFFSAEISKIWKTILLNQGNPYQTKIEAGLRKDFLDSVLLYYRIHLPEFRDPGSLGIVQEIFS